MNTIVWGAVIVMVSFWGGFITAALLNAGKEKSDGKPNGDTSESSERPADEAEGIRRSL